MSASTHRMSYDDGFADGVQSGITAEQERLLGVLVMKGVVRESLFSPGWWVLYTEQGPIDIKPETLLGHDWQKRTSFGTELSDLLEGMN